MKKIRIAILCLLLLFFVIGIYFYFFSPSIPERMASHWNVRGHVDGYIPKFWGLFLLPLLSLVIFLLFIILPYIYPLRDNIEKFRKYYDGFMILTIAFLFYVYLLIILWNTGVRISKYQLLAPAFGALFYYSGVLMEKAERNWLVGIRTAWTLSSDEVWRKTNKLGGKLFKLAGCIAVIGILFPRYAFFFTFVPAALVIICTSVYSFIAYQKEMKQ